jgi:hypothetical protein
MRNSVKRRESIDRSELWRSPDTDHLELRQLLDAIERLESRGNRNVEYPQLRQTPQRSQIAGGWTGELKAFQRCDAPDVLELGIAECPGDNTPQTGSRGKVGKSPGLSRDLYGFGISRDVIDRFDEWRRRRSGLVLETVDLQNTRSYSHARVWILSFSSLRESRN